MLNICKLDVPSTVPLSNFLLTVVLGGTFHLSCVQSDVCLIVLFEVFPVVSFSNY